AQVHLVFAAFQPCEEAAQAAKKAFIMTRFGDIGLFIGLVLLLLNLPVEAGESRGLLISSVLEAVNEGSLKGRLPYGVDLVTGIGLLLFCGIVGKSAQFPLHTWLPDAMEGPTPVSSLLHSATMVAAGVYLFALLQPLFLASQVTSTVALSVAVGTAVLSAGVAMVVLDMKRVLAWSSISQLSFMLMGLAAGSQVAGFFHLVTHAGFKCLLFLTAGILIHLAHSGNMVDMGRKVGGTSRAATFGLLVGAASLAGVPALAGFMSKEVVLAKLHHHQGFEGFYALALLGSAMTAYYSTRMVCLILRPAGGSQDHEDPDLDEDHEGPLTIMSAVVTVLALATLGIGWAGPTVAGHLGAASESVAIHWASPGVAMAMVALALGAGLAWRDFGAEGAARVGFIHRHPGVEHMLANGWYVDRFWRWISDRVVDSFIGLALLIDRSVVDENVDNLGYGARRGGIFTARLQNGRLQVYLSATLALLAVGLLLLTRI
ncbi:MAG: NADH-quinone oxidoreductase subunit L, partial [Deltaproteobacteria bacterium]|nr:NADH-quinone oxidoreductase subunit L [Deltaproteobacteria bacterium]